MVSFHWSHQPSLRNTDAIETEAPYPRFFIISNWFINFSQESAPANIYVFIWLCKYIELLRTCDCAFITHSGQWTPFCKEATDASQSRPFILWNLPVSKNIHKKSLIRWGWANYQWQKLSTCHLWAILKVLCLRSHFESLY